MEPRNTAYVAARWARSGLLAVGILIGLCLSCTPGSGNTGGQVGANDVPVLTFTRPNANTIAYTGQSVTITFFASDDDDPILVKLYFDRDGLADSGDEQLLTQFQKAAGDFSSDTYSWSTSSVALGLYHILAIVDDSNNPPVTVYNINTVTVQDSTPTLAVTSPFGPTSVVPAQNLVIQWTQNAPLGASTVALFYDTDLNYANGTAGTIQTFTQPAGSTGGSYIWNVPPVRSGRYYLGATLEDGAHPRIVAYASGYLDIAGPTLEVVNPAANVQWNGGGSLAIRYTVTTYRPGGMLRLFYDQDGVPDSGDETYLVTLQLVSGTASWTWTSGALPVGTYHVGGQIDDGLNDPVVDYAPGLVQELGPTLNVTAPTGVTTWHVGGSVDVKFVATGTSAQVEIFYDVDDLADSGDEVSLITGLPVQSGAQTTWTWQSAPLPHGTYHVGVKLTDGSNSPLVKYAPGTVVEAGPLLQFTSPSGSVTVGAGDQVPINFNYQSQALASTVRIFYDTNTSYDSGTDDPNTIPPTPKGEPAGAGSDSVTWTVPLLLAGTYYIGGVITAGSDTAVVYAGGIDVAGPQLTLTHPDAADTANPMMIGDPVTIQWSNTIPGNNPTMVLFYNSTKTTVGATTIASGLNPNTQVPAKTYDWVIPSGVASTVCIGATVTDDLGQTATSFAPGVITIPDPKQFDRDLADMTNYPDGSPNDPTGAILVFQGESAGGSLGQTIAGGKFYFAGQELESDLNGDGIPDFVLIATTGKPLILQSQTARYGEGYLLYGWPNPTDPLLPPIRRASQKVRLSQVTSPSWPGAMFPGVKYTTSSDGITSVAVLPNLEGDTNPVTGGPLLDLLFGLPYVHGVYHEDQDYDPIDQDNWDRPPADGAPDTYGNLTKLLPGAPDSNNPDPFTTIGGRGLFQTGMVVFAASTTSGAGFDGLVMALDDVGQASFNPLPRAVLGFGMRVYPETLFSAHGNSDLNDNTLFGKSVAVGDLDADGRADWLIAAPNGNGGAGYIEIIWRSKYGGGFDPGALPAYPGAQLNALSYPYVRTEPPTGQVTDRQWDVPWRASRQFINGEGSCNLNKPIIIGDFNGDERDDVACVGPGFNAGAGAAYIAFGSPTFGNFNVSGITNDATSLPGLKIVGAAGQQLGTSHARFGDINGDGYDDWAIGAAGYTYSGRTSCGAVAIIFGGASINGSRTLADVGDPTAGKLVPGRIIVGGHTNDAVGTYTVTAGDADGDGYLDILVSAPGYSYPGDPAATPPKPARSACGAVYLIYGGPALQPSNNVIDLAEVGRTVAGKVYIGPLANNRIGPVSSAGDVDQDGMDDFLIGNPSASPRGVTGAGEAYLIYGSARDKL